MKTKTRLLAAVVAACLGMPAAHAAIIPVNDDAPGVGLAAPQIGLPLAIAVLGLTAPAIAGAAVFAVLLGFGSGLKSIVQGTLPLALFGGVGYGVRLGRMAFYRQVAGAAAPFVFAAMLEGFGAAVALAALVAVGLAAVAAFVAIARLQPSG